MRPARLLRRGLAGAVAGAVAAAALAAGTTASSSAEPINLRATPQMKRALRTAFLRAHRELDARRVRGPLRGTVYYARLGRTEWALATFWMPRVGTTDQPELFTRAGRGRWRDRGDTGGSLCAVPRSVVRLWGLLRLRTSC